MVALLYCLVYMAVMVTLDQHHSLYSKELAVSASAEVRPSSG